MTPTRASVRVGEQGSVVQPNFSSATRILFDVVLLAFVLWWPLLLVLRGFHDGWAFDFQQFWQGGNDVVNGLSPYPTPEMLATSGDHLDAQGIQDVFRFPYPAGAAIVLAPFGALSFADAAAVWGVVLMGSVATAAWVLGVRDWRVLGVVISSAPVLSAIYLGTFTPVLILLLAVAWRWRERRWVVSGSLAAAISLKLFLWPLVFWLIATRRWAAAAGTAALAAAATLAAWAAIGFVGLADYPELVRHLTDIVQDRGLSFVALGVEAGLPEVAAETLPWVIGLSLLAAVIAVVHGEDGDRRAFSLTVVAAIVLSPIVWLHYFALLIVPLAVARPKISWEWGLVWVFWVIAAQGNEGDLWRILLAVTLLGAVAVASACAPRHRVAA